VNKPVPDEHPKWIVHVVGDRAIGQDHAEWLKGNRSQHVANFRRGHCCSPLSVNRHDLLYTLLDCLIDPLGKQAERGRTDSPTLSQDWRNANEDYFFGSGFGTGLG